MNFFRTTFVPNAPIPYNPFSTLFSGGRERVLWEQMGALGKGALGTKVVLKKEQAITVNPERTIQKN